MNTNRNTTSNTRITKFLATTLLVVGIGLAGTAFTPGTAAAATSTRSADMACATYRLPANTTQWTYTIFAQRHTTTSPIGAVMWSDWSYSPWHISLQNRHYEYENLKAGPRWIPHSGVFSGPPTASTVQTWAYVWVNGQGGWINLGQC